MFCYQCEQTAKGTGCDKLGVCGKTPEVSDLQDLLVYALTGLGQAATTAAAEGKDVPLTTGRFFAKALFSTLTNVNFDAADFGPLIEKTVAERDALAATLTAKLPEGPATFVPAADLDGLIKQGAQHGLKDIPETDPDIRSLKHTLIFGLKGIAAYADHAAILGQEDPAVYAFLYKGLADTFTTDKNLGDWVGLVLKCGEVNLRTMELLDAANTGAYGNPVPTVVPLGARAGKAILVSGHDLKDLKDLLEQTAGKGINIYTHGEMLPAHGYPELKKYPHFYGHYGTAWQNQHKEFAAFPGAILMTTNCIQKPAASYLGNIFTTGLVGWPGATHVKNGDFGPVIEKALAMPGFPEDTDKGTVMTGFGHNAVMGVAGAVIDAVKAGKIRHFFLVAGCDGAKPGRNYYTEFVEKAPADTIVLTLACGKFRFFDKKLGDIGGIPRLLDMGQCNDAYSAIQVAVALAKAFDCGVNELPLSMILSWYEQKAVAILLTLLHLGIKNMRLGPTLPAFLTPNVLNFLVENYDIKPISTPDEDLKAILG
ncbi:hybrid cluster protein [Solidesulfovibrio fructosivorans JJ]]|uniref:Hydroxylamine reductase n=1 Tax=Solidesulfovibrio fructosivorans JJ] TaxID=596151 RepID=E1K2G8_SOLFR|nr:hydroxylamine reductase [Solidesulfovibrio fructosivorans]EFL49201.1 hybrid cluster protein [Solidesulfovibrio fructosivorans JJ]]